MRTVVRALAGLVAVAVLTGCGGNASSPVTARAVASSARQDQSSPNFVSPSPPVRAAPPPTVEAKLANLDACAALPLTDLADLAPSSTNTLREDKQQCVYTSPLGTQGSQGTQVDLQLAQKFYGGQSAMQALATELSVAREIEKTSTGQIVKVIAGPGESAWETYGETRATGVEAQLSWVQGQTQCVLNVHNYIGSPEDAMAALRTLADRVSARL